MNWGLQEFEDYGRWERGLREASLSTYMTVAGLLRTYCEKQQAAFPTEQIVRDWLRELRQRGLAPHSLETYRACAVQYVKWYSARGSNSEAQEAARSCAAALDAIRIRLPQRTRQPLGQEAVERWLSQPDISTYAGLRDRAAMELMYCGMRIGEVVRLKPPEIDEASRLVYIVGKGGRQRVIKIPEQTMAIVSKWIAARRGESPALFETGIHGLRLRVQRYAEKANLGHQIPHILRHSCAKQMADNGASIWALQQVLGHSNIKTTELYANSNSLRGWDAMDTCHPRAF